MNRKRIIPLSLVLAFSFLAGPARGQEDHSRILELLRQRRERAASQRAVTAPGAEASSVVEETPAPEPAADLPLLRDRGEIIMEATGRIGRGEGAHLVLTPSGGIKEEGPIPKLRYEWVGRVDRKTMINLAGRRSRKMDSYIKGQTAMFTLLGVAGHKVLQKQKEKAKGRAAVDDAKKASVASALAGMLGGAAAGQSDGSAEGAEDAYTDDSGYSDDSGVTDEGLPAAAEGGGDDGGYVDDGGYDDDSGYVDDGGYEDAGAYEDDGGYY